MPISMPAPDLAPAPLAVGDLVQTSQAYRDRHLWPAGRKAGRPCTAADPWVGVVLELGARVLCGQRPTACRCHLDFADDERPEVSSPTCPDCRGDGEARWRTLDHADLQHAPPAADHPDITRTLPR